MDVLWSLVYQENGVFIRAMLHPSTVTSITVVFAFSILVCDGQSKERGRLCVDTALSSTIQRTLDLDSALKCHDPSKLDNGCMVSCYISGDSGASRTWSLTATRDSEVWTRSTFAMYAAQPVSSKGSFNDAQRAVAQAHVRNGGPLSSAQREAIINDTMSSRTEFITKPVVAKEPTVSMSLCSGFLGTWKVDTRTLKIFSDGEARIFDGNSSSSLVAYCIAPGRLAFLGTDMTPMHATLLGDTFSGVTTSGPLRAVKISTP